MAQDEGHGEVGTAVIKYQETKKELAGLEDRLREQADTFKKISDSIYQGTLEVYGEEIGVYGSSDWFTSIPTFREVSDLLREIKTVKGLLETWRKRKEELGVEEG